MLDPRAATKAQSSELDLALTTHHDSPGLGTLGSGHSSFTSPLPVPALGSRAHVERNMELDYAGLHAIFRGASRPDTDADTALDHAGCDVQAEIGDNLSLDVHESALYAALEEFFSCTRSLQALKR